jgi:hypothetical protein
LGETSIDSNYIPVTVLVKVLTLIGQILACTQRGQVELPLDLAKQIGYDPSRTWSAGQTPDQFVMLGDVQDAFHLEAFSLKDISDLTALGMQNLNLDDLGLTRWQTPSSLVKAIPELGSLNLSQVQPLEDLAVKWLCLW